MLAQAHTEGYIDRGTDLNELTRAVLDNIREEVLCGSIAQYQHLSKDTDCKKVRVTVKMEELHEGIVICEAPRKKDAIA